jgi:pilus assembly protein CpaC
MAYRLFYFISILFMLGVQLVFSELAHAQKVEKVAAAQDVTGTRRFKPQGYTNVEIDHEAALIAYRPEQIALYLGEKDSSIFTQLPNGVVFTGGYKKIGGISFNKEKNLFEFQATAIGQESLTVLDSFGNRIFDIRIHVRPVSLSNIASQIRQSLQGIDSVVITPKSGKIMVSGSVCSIHDFQRVGDAVAKHGGGFAINDVTFLRSEWAKLAERLQASIDKNFKMSRIKVKSERDQLVLEGTTTSPNEKEKAASLAFVLNAEKKKGSCSPVLSRRSVVNDIRVIGALAEKKKPEATIELVIQLVELQPDYEARLGVQGLEPSPIDRQPARAIAFGTSAPKKGMVTNLGSKLNWAQQSGYARVLKTAKFIGGEREAWSLKESVRLRKTMVQEKPGNEPVNAAVFSTSSEHDVDFRFLFHPNVDSLDKQSVRLVLNVTTESKRTEEVKSGESTLPSASLQEIVTVKSGESAVVANFIPLLSWMGGNIVPVGDSSGPFASLFSSKDYLDRKSRFVLFVTPIIRTSSLGN